MKRIALFSFLATTNQNRLPNGFMVVLTKILIRVEDQVKIIILQVFHEGKAYWRSSSGLPVAVEPNCYRCPHKCSQSQYQGQESLQLYLSQLHICFHQKKKKIIMKNLRWLYHFWRGVGLGLGKEPRQC